MGFDASDPELAKVNSPRVSPAEDVREDQRRDDRGIAFDDELGRVLAEFAPGDLLVGYGAGVRAVTGG